MARSSSASSPASEPRTRRLCACTIIVEIPADLDDQAAQRILDVIEQNHLEEQALEALAWHLRDKRCLRAATARLER